VLFKHWVFVKWATCVSTADNDEVFVIAVNNKVSTVNNAEDM
jgi:hypothetical protein